MAARILIVEDHFDINLAATSSELGDVAKPPRTVQPVASRRRGIWLEDAHTAGPGVDAPAAHGVHARHVEHDTAAIDELKENTIARRPLGPRFHEVRSCHG